MDSAQLSKAFPVIDAISLNIALHKKGEIAVIDPREEGIFGKAHLLLAVNVPLSRLEINIGRLVPRKSTRIVLTDDNDGVANRAAAKLEDLGYSDLAILDGGTAAWRAAGFELFSGMSVPTKAFGEWIAVTCNTPLITAEELHAKLANGEDILILDSRPANEYRNMNIPGSINVPVSELVYRFFELPVSPRTLIVVNCAGRTRSLIGAQTLIDAGVPNRVVALRGGTMAWQMAGFQLEHGAARHAPEPWGKSLEQAQDMAARVAERLRMAVIDEMVLDRFKSDGDSRSLYVIDVRTPDEFHAGHRPDSIHAWGVQLVQSIDRYVATRNARIVLVDNYRVRALMTAAWLSQIGWGEVFVLDEPFQHTRLVTSSDSKTAGTTPLPLPTIDSTELSGLLETGEVALIDFSDSLSYRTGHIPGAWFMIRSRIAADLSEMPAAARFVVTGSDVAVTSLAARDLAIHCGKPVTILTGGTRAWQEAGLPVTSGPERMASQPDDIFRMPFLWGHFDDWSEFEAAAQAYFEWELQLPGQLERSGEISFFRP